MCAPMPQKKAPGALDPMPKVGPSEPCLDDMPKREAPHGVGRKPLDEQMPVTYYCAQCASGMRTPFAPIPEAMEIEQHCSSCGKPATLQTLTVKKPAPQQIDLRTLYLKHGGPLFPSTGLPGATVFDLYMAAALIAVTPPLPNPSDRDLVRAKAPDFAQVARMLAECALKQRAI